MVYTYTLMDPSIFSRPATMSNVHTQCHKSGPKMHVQLSIGHLCGGVFALTGLSLVMSGLTWTMKSLMSGDTDLWGHVVVFCGAALCGVGGFLLGAAGRSTPADPAEDQAVPH